jgi:ParB family chromosome partitioning protein
VDIEWVVANPFQPRVAMDTAELEELAESIRQHGVLQPLLVSRVDTSRDAPTYQIIAGGRRLQAARIAGLTHVPVVVKETTPRQALELALVENIQRADLNPLEEAAAYRRLVDEFGLSQGDLGARLGRSRSAVANSLRLLSLSEELKASLAGGEISEGHARALLGLPEEGTRRRLWKEVVRKGLSVRQTEALVRALTGAKKAARRRAVGDPDVLALEERLRAALSTKVSLVKGRRGGRITIHFYSDEELEGIIDRLLPS